MDQKGTQMVEIKKACKALEKMGITSVVLEYSGSGDSGAVDSIVFYNGEVEHTGPVPYGDEVFNDDEEGSAKMKVFLECLTDYIEGDWYNNDGGQGTITLLTKEKRMEISAGYNHMETTNHDESVEII